MAKIHDAESADEGKRNGHAGDDGGPDVPQKGKDDEDDENDGNGQGDFNVAHGSANGSGAVHGHGEMQRGRNRGAEKREKGHNTVDGLNHVGARLSEDGHEDAALSVRKAQIAGIFDSIDDLGNIAQADRSALMPGDNQGFIFVSFEELIGRGDIPSPTRIR